MQIRRWACSGLLAACLPGVTVAQSIPTVQIPTPQPVPTVAIPSDSAQSILASMREVLLQAGSAHFETDIIAHLSVAHWITLQTDGDISWRRQELEESSVAIRGDEIHSRLLTSTQRWHIIVFQGFAAARNQSASWSCTRSGSQVATSLLPFQLHDLHAQSMTSTVLDRVPVWHIQASGTLAVTGKGQIATLTFDIARQTYTLLRTTAATVEEIAGQPAPLTITERYSHFGEAINIHLPGACLTRTAE